MDRKGKIIDKIKPKNGILDLLYHDSVENIRANITEEHTAFPYELQQLQGRIWHLQSQMRFIHAEHYRKFSNF